MPLALPFPLQCTNSVVAIPKSHSLSVEPPVLESELEPLEPEPELKLEFELEFGLEFEPRSSCLPHTPPGPPEVDHHWIKKRTHGTVPGAALVSQSQSQCGVDVWWGICPNGITGVHTVFPYVKRRVRRAAPPGGLYRNRLVALYFLHATGFEATGSDTEITIPK